MEGTDGPTIKINTEERTDRLQGISLFPEVNVLAIPKFEGGTSRKNVRYNKTSLEGPTAGTIPEALENLESGVVLAGRR